MKFSTTRPQTADLAVCLFARPLHPELFDVLERYEYAGEKYQASISLTSYGHVFEYRVNGQTLTEVLDWNQSQLPRIKRLCLYSTDRPRSLRFKLDGGLCIQVCFNCEYLSADVYRRVQQEHWKQAEQATLAHTVVGTEFELTPPLSFLNVDPLAESLGIHTFHLYPDERAIVKTQSLFTFDQADK